MTSLGLLLGSSFEPRNLGLMFGFMVLPMTFPGGTYYQWTRLAPVKVGGWHWLQAVVLVNPLIYVNDGMRSAFTNAPHMHLYVIHPALAAFSIVLLSLGLRSFRRRRWPSHLLVAVPTEAKDVEAVTVGLETLGLGESLDGGCHVPFEGRGRGDVDDLATVRAQEVVVVLGELFGQLVASELVVGRDPPHHSGDLEVDEVAIGRAAR